MKCPVCGSEDVRDPKDALNGVGFCSDCGHQWSDQDEEEQYGSDEEPAARMDNGDYLE